MSKKHYLDKGLILVYSPDEYGYYFQDTKTWKVSVWYKTKQKAITAYKNNAIIWEDKND